MDRLIERVVGLDVHKATLKACVRVPDEQGGRRSETRTFRATTAGLVLLCDWLASFGIQVVGMESTGVFWRPVSYLLEPVRVLAAQRGASPQRARPQDRRGRRRLDHATGRARPGPPLVCAPKPIRQLRELTRYRKALSNKRTHEAQRLHKTLEDAGIKLSSVAGDVLGTSRPGDAAAAGGRHHRPAGAGRAGQGRLRAKLPALREALQGRFDRVHGLLVTELLAHIDYLDEAVARLSREI